MNIPLVDLKAQHDSIKQELNDAIQRIIDKSEFIMGEDIRTFEKEFAKYCQKEFCVGASNGSTALLTVLKCLGINPGDEVIMPTNTFIATAFSATLCGAKPVFVDVNQEDSLINTSLIEEKITEKTKAIIPVHLYGNVCDMDKIITIAQKHNLIILEDCAQAHGSEYKGKKVPVTETGCFSFFPAKTLGAMGDAGAIVTSDKKLYEQCKKYVNHGRMDKYFHDTEGFNYRLDNIQAAILNVKLKYLDSWIEKRLSHRGRYDEALKEIVVLQKTAQHIKNSSYIYVLRTKKRDELQKYLKENGIETGVHYPIPLHLQPALSYLGYKEGDFPVAESSSKEILSIPLFPELNEQQQNKIIKTIKDFICQSV